MNTTSFGGQCPPPSVLTRLDGTLGQESGGIRQLGGGCSSVRLKTSTVTEPWTYSVEITPAPFQGVNGSSVRLGATFSQVCPANMVIDQFGGLVDIAIGQIYTRCSGFEIVRSAGNVWNIRHRGSMTSATAGMGMGNPFEWTTPDSAPDAFPSPAAWIRGIRSSLMASDIYAIEVGALNMRLVTR